MFRFRQTQNVHKLALLPLTTKPFYDLAGQCHAFAKDLARLDPLHVDLPSCHRYNDWLPTVRAYDKLVDRITVRTARPIARWQLLTLWIVSWLFLLLALPGRVDRIIANSILTAWGVGLMIFFFVPQRLYGTTVELLEGRILLIVETMQQLLYGGEITFSEGAYFRVKQMLEETQRELRQQLDLIHRNDRSYL